MSAQPPFQTRMLPPPDLWHNLPAAQRRSCLQAAARMIRAMQTLTARQSQVVHAILEQREFVEWEHYPDDDVRDPQHFSQYFYHAHAGALRPFDEHGHFHLFIHADDAAIRRPRAGREMAPAHLLALSMDAHGQPKGLFCTNRWVTKGPWLSQQESLRGLQLFNVKGRRGHAPVNHFLRALLDLYQPLIPGLLQQRDLILQQLCATRDIRSVFADKSIEVLCYQPIDPGQDIARLEMLA